MNEKREFQNPVSIAELAQKKRAEDGTAYQEIAGQLSQIPESSQSTVQSSTIQNPSSSETSVRLVQRPKTSGEARAAKRQEMLRRFEKAAA